MLERWYRCLHCRRPCRPTGGMGEAIHFDGFSECRTKYAAISNIHPEELTEEEFELEIRLHG